MCQSIIEDSRNASPPVAGKTVETTYKGKMPDVSPVTLIPEPPVGVGVGPTTTFWVVRLVTGPGAFAKRKASYPGPGSFQRCLELAKGRLLAGVQSRGRRTPPGPSPKVPQLPWPGHLRESICPCMHDLGLKPLPR